ncbi:MAG: tyrosine-type recombinase/integrase [Myxococcota bacterium]
MRRPQRSFSGSRPQVSPEKQASLFQGVWPPRGARQKATGKVMQRNTVLQMVKRRAERLGMDGNLCTHSFRATGITAYVEAGGSLQTAAQMAGNADVRTTQLYVRSSEKSLRSEAERIRFE